MKYALTLLCTSFFVITTIAQSNVNVQPLIKNGIAPKIKMDSTIYSYYSNSKEEMVSEGKQEYYYDEQGNELVRFVYAFDGENNIWKKNKKWESEYDATNKLTVVLQYKWNSDSADWINEFKQEFGYDTNLNLISIKSYSWRTNPYNGTELYNWIGLEKFEYEYDSNGNKLLDSEYEWNLANNDWEGVSKLTFSFDSAGNQTLRTKFSWGGISFEEGQWIYGWREDRQYENKYNSLNLLMETVERYWATEWTNQYKDEFAYNSKGEIELHTRYSWNYNSIGWRAIEKYELVSDTINRKAVATSAQWYESDSTWHMLIKSEIELDEEGNTIKQVDWNFDSSLDSLVFQEKMVSEYDSNGNRTSYIESGWDKTVNDWKFVFQEETSYDFESRVTSLARWHWKADSGMWIGWEKFETIYDDSGNIVRSLKYLWNSDEGDWISDLRTDFEFDTSVSFSNLVLPNYWKVERKMEYELDFETAYSYDRLSASWKVKNETKHYYSGFVANGLNKEVLGQLLIYPNPTDDFIYISNVSGPVQIDLFAISGEMLMSTEINSEKAVSVKQFKPGLYIYKISSNNTLKSGKIIIQ